MSHASTMTDFPNLYEQAREVARHLPGSWRYNHFKASKEGQDVSERMEHCREAVIQSDHQLPLELRLRPLWDNHKRLSIYGLFPRDLTGVHVRSYQPGSKAVITVSRDRSAKAIAGDIERRLLPAYREEFKTWQEQDEAAAQQIASVTVHADAVRRLCPEFNGWTYGAQSAYFEAAGQYRTRFGSLRYWSGGELTLELNRLDMDAAMRVLGLLVQIEAERLEANDTA